jgi:hypothetical protein
MMVIDRLISRLNEPVSLAPLVFLRIVFGLIMCFSTIRFMYNGWVESLYLEPEFFFTFWDIPWIAPLPEFWMFAAYIVMAIAALGIALGAWFRISAITFLLLFSYIELIDKTYYLNHYYFVSIFCFLLLISPAHKRFSIDVLRNAVLRQSHTANWYRAVFLFQLSIVYFFAGMAKLQSDWLLEAMPLKIWLPAREDLPLIGSLLKYEATAYVFSWSGAIYDLFIPFILLNRKTVWYGYAGVVVFHMFTWLLFPIGVFPWVMIGATTIFLPAIFTENLLSRIEGKNQLSAVIQPVKTDWKLFVSIFLFIQLIIPLRFLLYSNNVLWYEEGFRFSWRVMLVEKNGSLQYRVEEIGSNKMGIEEPSTHLTSFQQKQMCVQPDMILQYAHFIGAKYKKQGKNVKVYADSFVSFNGRASQRYVREEVDLMQITQQDSREVWMTELQTEAGNAQMRSDLSNRSVNE